MSAADPDSEIQADDSSTDDPPPTGPVLASDALREELAPQEPLGRASRAWCCVIGLTLLAIAGFSPGTAPRIACAGVGLATIASGAMPLGYLARAHSMVALALGLGLSAALGLSPLPGPPGSLEAGSLAPGSLDPVLLSRLLATVPLPAALLFRARYRAYAGARRILALGLALEAPFVAAAARRGAGEAVVQVATGIAALSVLASIFGFMGSHARIAGDHLAALIITSIAAESAVACLAPAQLASLGAAGAPPAIAQIGLGAVALAGVAALGTLGLFQVLAARHWKRARQIDVLSAVPEPPPPPPSRTSHPDSWSTHS